MLRDLCHPHKSRTISYHIQLHPCIPDESISSSRPRQGELGTIMIQCQRGRNGCIDMWLTPRSLNCGTSESGGWSKLRVKLHESSPPCSPEHYYERERMYSDVRTASTDARRRREDGMGHESVSNVPTYVYIRYA